MRSCCFTFILTFMHNSNKNYLHEFYILTYHCLIFLKLEYKSTSMLDWLMVSITLHMFSDLFCKLSLQLIGFIFVSKLFAHWIIIFIFIIISVTYSILLFILYQQISSIAFCFRCFYRYNFFLSWLKLCRKFSFCWCIIFLCL